MFNTSNILHLHSGYGVCIFLDDFLLLDQESTDNPDKEVCTSNSDDVWSTWILVDKHQGMETLTRKTMTLTRHDACLDNTRKCRLEKLSMTLTNDAWMDNTHRCRVKQQQQWHRQDKLRCMAWITHGSAGLSQGYRQDRKHGIWVESERLAVELDTALSQSYLFFRQHAQTAPPYARSLTTHSPGSKRRLGYWRWKQS